jgi:hypothetical protein
MLKPSRRTTSTRVLSGLRTSSGSLWDSEQLLLRCRQLTELMPVLTPVYMTVPQNLLQKILPTSLKTRTCNAPLLNNKL